MSSLARTAPELATVDRDRLVRAWLEGRSPATRLAYGAIALGLVSSALGILALMT